MTALWRKQHSSHFTKENELRDVVSCPKIPPGIYNRTELQARFPTLESSGTAVCLFMLLAASEMVKALYCSFLTQCGVFETQFAFRILWP